MMPAQKPEGATRLIYENGNGFNSRISNNDKLDKHTDVHMLATWSQCPRQR